MREFERRERVASAGPRYCAPIRCTGDGARVAGVRGGAAASGSAAAGSTGARCFEKPAPVLDDLRRLAVDLQPRERLGERVRVPSARASRAG